jgi:nucleotide-binding universal stress UspA family protein
MFKKILVPVDVSVDQDTQGLLQATKNLTQGWDCEIHILTVIPNFGMAIVGSFFDESFENESKAAAKAQLCAAVADCGLGAQQSVLHGTIYDCVIEYAQKMDADLIVIGAHQPKLRDYLLGSNAARVVRHSKQSILVIRDTDN